MVDLEKTDVVILCGGLGNRLRPSVGETQKTLADIDGKPFLDILLGYLAAQGFKRIILCTGFNAEGVEARYTNNPLDLDIQFSREEDPLGTGGAIKNTRTLVQSDPFFALNGDCFCALNYRDFLDFHFRKEATLSIVLSPVEERKDFGSIQIDGSARVVKFEEKGPVGRAAHSQLYANAGIYCFQKAVFDLMPEGDRFSIEYDFFAKCRDEKFFGYVVDQKFIDIGTPERYEDAKRSLGKGE